MVKLIKEDANQAFAKALSSADLSDDQLAIIRRGQKIFQALGKAGLKAEANVTPDGVQLKIGMGNNAGVILTVANTDQHVDIEGSANLKITEDSLKQLMNLVKITSAM